MSTPGDRYVTVRTMELWLPLLIAQRRNETSGMDDTFTACRLPVLRWPPGLIGASTLNDSPTLVRSLFAAG
jgi:hypothetical protein